MFRSLMLMILVVGLGLGIQRGWVVVDWSFMQADLRILWQQLFDQPLSPERPGPQQSPPPAPATGQPPPLNPAGDHRPAGEAD